jgi:hypothetical protein
MALAYMEKYNPTMIENHGIPDADTVLHLHNIENDEHYTLIRTIRGYWVCTCPDRKYRGPVCKHITDVHIYLIN